MRISQEMVCGELNAAGFLLSLTLIIEATAIVFWGLVSRASIKQNRYTCRVTAT
jgi:hypothetical protein